MARIPALFLLLHGLFSAAAAHAAESFQLGRFGAVPVVRPAGQPSRVALLVSGENGFGARESALAETLAVSGALVLEVDTSKYLTAGKQHRLYPAADFEVLSQFGQKELGLPAYRQPVLVGIGAGATLVYAALAEAPPNTFAGAVSVGFCPILPLSRPLSRGRGLSQDRKWPGPGIRLLPFGGIENPWLILDAPEAACAAGPAAAFAKSVPAARVIPVPAGAAAAAATKQQLSQALAILAEESQREASAQAARGELRDLPLTEVAAKGAVKDALAVIVSGSGGYVGFDRKMGKNLAERGVPVVGLSSLAYFWKPREPDGAARDLARILGHYLAAWHKSRAIVIGYSQGADVMPFMVARLPPELRARLSLVVLIGPDGGARFDLRPDGWISKRPERAEIPEAPEMPKLKGLRVLCVYGAGEAKSLCPQLGPDLAKNLQVPGGHGFEGDAPRIADRALAEAGL
jgi:type IV secretory pathway VirJ component